VDARFSLRYPIGVRSCHREVTFSTRFFSSKNINDLCVSPFSRPIAGTS
jgi:hypothetical protein